MTNVIEVSDRIAKTVMAIVYKEIGTPIKKSLYLHDEKQNQDENIECPDDSGKDPKPVTKKAILSADSSNSKPVSCEIYSAYACKQVEVIMLLVESCIESHYSVQYLNLVNGVNNAKLSHTESDNSVDVATSSIDKKDNNTKLFNNDQSAIVLKVNQADIGSTKTFSKIILSGINRSLSSDVNITKRSACHSNLKTYNVSQSKSNVFKCDYILLDDYAHSLASYVIHSAISDAVFCDLKLHCSVKNVNDTRNPVFENYSDKFSNSSQDYDRFRMKNRMTSLEHVCINKCTCDKDIALCDTFLYGMLSSDCTSNDCKTKPISITCPKNMHVFQGNKSKKNKRVEKKKKKLLKKLTTLQVPRYEDFCFLTDSKVECNEYDFNHAVSCPVCLDIFYNPFNCMPCSHSFCEPCLRRLSKYNSDKRRDHRCPICREIISYCEKNEGLKVKVQSLLPEEYKARQKTEYKEKYMTYQLPSKPTKVSLQDIASRIRERNRIRTQEQNNQGPRFWTNIRTIDFWKILLFVLLKGIVIVVVSCFGNLASNEHKFNTYVEYYRTSLWNYSNLDGHSQAKVTNEVVLLLFMAGSVILLGFYVKRRLRQAQRLL